jgi:hypothetical protein
MPSSIFCFSFRSERNSRESKQLPRSIDEAAKWRNISIIFVFNQIDELWMDSSCFGLASRCLNCCMIPEFVAGMKI